MPRRPYPPDVEALREAWITAPKGKRKARYRAFAMAVHRALQRHLRANRASRDQRQMTLFDRED